MMHENTFLDAMHFRYACKIFDPSRKIPEHLFQYILECGRLSPSSFGMEPWKFMVVRSRKTREALRPLCWGQAQITDASELVIILAAVDLVRPQSQIPQQRFQRRPLSQEQIDAYIEKYSAFLHETFLSDEKTYAWSAKQCYIALANMMSAAAYEKIDSCPIEGFEKESVEALLKLDTTQYQVAVMLALGYRAQEQPPRCRLSLDEVVDFV
jgi:nitroreductase